MGDQSVFVVQYGDIALAFIGFVAGAVASILTSAWFSDHFYVRALHKRTNILPSGEFRIYAPGREDKARIIEWNASISTRWLLRGSYLTMSCSWADKFIEKKILWKYYGPIRRRGSFVIANLNLERFPSDDTLVKQVKFRTPQTAEDPAVLILHRSTENWSVRPCVICGFDYTKQCYGALGVMVRNEATIEKEKIEDLLKEESFLNYDAMFGKLNNLLHSSA